MEQLLLKILMPLKRRYGPGRWAPVFAFELGGGKFRVLGMQPGYEQWRWPADCIVLCEYGESGLLASKLVRQIDLRPDVVTVDGYLGATQGKAAQSSTGSPASF